MFTPEQRAKGLATRLANKAVRDAKASSKIRQVVQGVKPHVAAEETNGHSKKVAGNAGETQDFDWETAPLSEASTKAAELKREYERVAAILVRRQNPANHKWTCWSIENPSLVPSSVKKQCLKHGDDGKWKFRDDGRFIMENGVRTLRPAFCCNFLCYAIYQKHRVTQKIEAGV